MSGKEVRMWCRTRYGPDWWDCAEKQMRKQEAVAALARAPKRSAPVDVRMEVICPITLEVPTDPVMAEDGRIYERHAIETWFRTHEGTPRSPYTLLPMGRALSPPCVQLRAVLSALREGG